MFNTLTIQYPSDTQYFQQIVSKAADGGPAYYFNQDTANTVWLTTKPSGNPTTVDAAPLLPQTGLSLDGSIDVYAFCAVKGLTAIVAVFPSATSFNTAAVVTNLFSGGTPSGVSALTVAAGVTTTILNMVDVSLYNSYDITFGAFLQNQGIGENAFTARITFTWYDAPGVIVYSETFEPWVGNNVLANLGGYPNTWGSGKMHGRYLSVTLFNYSATAPASLTVQYLSIFASPRIVDNTLWRQDASTGLAVNPGAGGFSWVSAYQTASGAISPGAAPAGNENILAQIDSVAVGASSKNFWPFSMFNGPVTIRYNQSGTWANAAAICSAAGGISGNILPGASNAGIVTLLPNITGQETQVTINAPHAPLFLVTTANTTPPTFSLIAVAKEGQ